MAIRLRTVDGVRVALCAVESKQQPGDVYLDDADHGALSCKFAMDHESMGFLRAGLTPLWLPEQETAMRSQKVCDAQEELNRWLKEVQQQNAQLQERIEARYTKPLVFR